MAHNLKAAKEEILEADQDGRPLVVEKKCGKGSIVFFNTLCYPAHPAICRRYTQEFESRCDRLNAEESVFPVVADDVQAVVYDLEDGAKVVYFLAVDWWNDPQRERRAQLRINGTLYSLSLPFGVLKKVLVQDEKAVVCQQETADVLRFTQDGFVAQGVGVEEFLVLEKGSVRSVYADFSSCPQRKVRLL